MIMTPALNALTFILINNTDIKTIYADSLHKEFII